MRFFSIGASLETGIVPAEDFGDYQDEIFISYDDFKTALKSLVPGQWVFSFLSESELNEVLNEQF